MAFRMKNQVSVLSRAQALRILVVTAALFAWIAFLPRAWSQRPADPAPGEWQLTASPISHLLDNNDNFSRDDRFLVVDTRDTVGTGIGNGTMIMKVSISTGLENIIYAPYPVLTGTNAAPGLGAVSYNPLADEVAFIHGPLVSETPKLGFYRTTNRRGGVVLADGSGDLKGFLDYRDIDNEVTTPGAHRGGTHRHEYTLDGSRVGFTYDDELMPTYGRTIGMLVPHPSAPGGASHWAVLLLPMAPTNGAAPGQLERAADDSWIGARGLMRGFIGRVKEENGSYTNSLFIVDVPENVDVTTANAGTKTQFPTPPAGVRVRRITTAEAAGIVRGSHDGSRVGYFAVAPDGTRQVFIVPSNGSDQATDPALRPVQATRMATNVTGGLRWHPSGNSIAAISDGGVFVTCVKPGPLFGVSVFLTAHGSGVPAADALVWSHNGKMLAFNRRIPTYDATGRLLKDAGGNDFRQIFLVMFPDENDNGIADPIE
jgi:hypothetical protein